MPGDDAEPSWLCPSCHRRSPLSQAQCACGYQQVYLPTMPVRSQPRREWMVVLFLAMLGGVVWWLLQ